MNDKSFISQKCKATNEKKNREGKLMGTCTQLQAQVKKKERKRNGETQNKDRTRFTERVQKTPLNPTMGHQRSEGTKSERSNI